MLQRISTKQTVTVTDSVATSEEIRFSAGCFGRVIVPTGSSITSLTWYESDEYGGTYVAAQDENGDAVVQTVAAAKTYQIPLTLAGSRALKAVGDAAGTIIVLVKG